MPCQGSSNPDVLLQALQKVQFLKANEASYGEKEKQKKMWKDAVIHLVRRYQQLSDEAKQSLRDGFPSVMRVAHSECPQWTVMWEAKTPKY